MKHQIHATAWLVTAILYIGISLTPQLLQGQTPTIEATMDDQPEDLNGAPGTQGGDEIKYNVIINNTGTGDAEDVEYENTVDPNTIFVPGSIRTTPIALNETYTTTGNIPLSVAAPGVLDNDFDADLVGPGLTVSAGVTSTNGGTVSMSSDGSFTYNPPPGFEGTDTFTYTLDDNEGNSDIATVSITVSGMIWFIDNTAGAGGNGQLNTPFNSISAFNAINNGTGSNPAPGDNIFIYESSTNYTGPVTLLNNQRLIGQDATSDLSTLTGLTENTGDFPVMNSANGTKVNITSSANDINLAQNNQLHGFTLSNATGTAISGSTFGTLTVADVAINTTGQALSLTTGTLSGGFTSVTSSGGTNNILLTSVASSGTFALGSGALSGATGTSFSVSGGSVSLSFSGTITQSNNAGMMSISGGHSGTLAFSTGTLSASNGSGILFDNADGTYTFSGIVTLSGGNAHLEVLAGSDGTNGSQGTITFSNTNASSKIENPSGGVLVKVTSSTATLNYAGTLTRTSNLSNHAIDVQSNKGGTTTLSGASKTLNAPVASTAGSEPVYLNGNTGGTTLAFTGGGLSISSNANIGMFASNTAIANATLKVQGSGNTITTTSATALSVTNTTIGASAGGGEGGLNFRNITINASGSSSFATAGIILNNTGTSGGLKVTGNSGAGTGGTIQKLTGSNGSSNGVGIYLHTTKDVSLAYMQLNEFQNFAIQGTNVTNVTLENSVINGTNGNNNAAGSQEGAIRFDGLFGIASITDCTIGGVGGSDVSFSDNIRVTNSSGTLNRLTISGSSFGKIGTSGNNSITFVGSSSAVMNLTLEECTLTNGIGSLLTVAANQNSTMDLVVRRNEFSNNNSSAASGATNLSIQGDASGTSATVTYDISCNRFRDALGNAVLVAKGNGGGTFTGSIINNVIGVSGSSTSGSTQGSGVKVAATGTGTHTVMIADNDVRRTNEAGIFILSNDGSCTVNATIFNNIVAEPESFSYAGLSIDAGAVSGDANVINVVVGSATTGALKNDFSTGDPSGFSDVNFSQQQSATINLSKNGSASGTVSAVIKDNNNNSAATAVGVSGTVTLVTSMPSTPPSVSSCTLP